MNIDGLSSKFPLSSTLLHTVMLFFTNLRPRQQQGCMDHTRLEQNVEQKGHEIDRKSAHGFKSKKHAG